MQKIYNAHVKEQIGFFFNLICDIWVWKKSCYIFHTPITSIYSENYNPTWFVELSFYYRPTGNFKFSRQGSRRLSIPINWFASKVPQSGIFFKTALFVNDIDSRHRHCGKTDGSPSREAM